MSWDKWAIEEIKKAGLYDKDSDYGGLLGKALEELVKVFAKQGHSDYSASIVNQLFYRLVRYKPLTPITNDLDEWNFCWEDGEKVYQAKRCPYLFATESQLKENKAKDSGYYYKVDEEGLAYRDNECSKIVDLPYYPPTDSKLLNNGKVLNITEEQFEKMMKLGIPFAVLVGDKKYLVKVDSVVEIGEEVNNG